MRRACLALILLLSACSSIVHTSTGAASFNTIAPDAVAVTTGYDPHAPHGEKWTGVEVSVFWRLPQPYTKEDR